MRNILSPLCWCGTLAALGLALMSSPSVAADVSNIAREVRHELVMLPYYSIFDNLAFRVDPDSTVTLMGQVVRPTLKDDAGRAVKKIPGVTSSKMRSKSSPSHPMTIASA